MERGTIATALSIAPAESSAASLFAADSLVWLEVLHRIASPFAGG
jgi:hypothetical protein